MIKKIRNNPVTVWAMNLFGFVLIMQALRHYINDLRVFIPIFIGAAILVGTILACAIDLVSRKNNNTKD